MFNHHYPFEVKNFDGYGNKHTTRLKKTQNKDIKHLRYQVILDKRKA